MMVFVRSRHWALLLSGMAMLSFLGRTFIDYRFVFPEIGVTTADLLPITFGILVFYGVWLWALIASGRGSRNGLAVLLVYNLLLLVFGISTFTTLCPSPCSTAWPTGEILMWSNVTIGIAAVITETVTTQDAVEIHFRYTNPFNRQEMSGTDRLSAAEAKEAAVGLNVVVLVKGTQEVALL